MAKKPWRYWESIFLEEAHDPYDGMVWSASVDHDIFKHIVRSEGQHAYDWWSEVIGGINDGVIPWGIDDKFSVGGVDQEAAIKVRNAIFASAKKPELTRWLSHAEECTVETLDGSGMWERETYDWWRTYFADLWHFYAMRCIEELGGICEEVQPPAKREHTPLTGHVYLIEAKLDDKVIQHKIGMTTGKPEKRCRDIARQLPFSCHVVAAVESDDVRDSEYRMHETFKKYRKNGEWFQFPDPLLAEIQDSMLAGKLPIKELA